MIVMKFGGTSVGSGARIVEVAKIIAAEQARQPIVVVSALKQVTNGLVELATHALNRDEPALLTAGLEQLRHTHREAAEALQLETVDEQALLSELDATIKKLEAVLDSIAALEELTPRGHDLIVSFGERLSTHLVAAALEQQGIAALAVEASDLIVTDDNFGNAGPLFTASCQRMEPKLQKLLDSKVTPVITGFMGANEAGVVTTLGRGGSDYSATIIGHCMKVDEVSIWTDVDGVMTADPRIVDGAHTISELSYDEAAELSYFGAKVLHPRTMVAASLSDIPIFIKNSFHPEVTGTKISSKTHVHPDAAKAMSVLKNLSLITIQGKGMQGVFGLAARVFTTLAELRINVLFISQASSENNISLVVSGQDGAKAAEALRAVFEPELNNRNMETVQEQPNLAMIAVVGEGMRHHTCVAGRIFSALGAADIDVIAIAQGSSERNISLVVSAEQAAKALQSVHDEFYLADGSNRKATA